MPRPVDSIRNLGPASVAQFARAGIDTAEEVIEMGADAAYARLVAAGTRPHFIGYYALVMGLQGRPWNDLGPEEKAALRQRFDRIVGGGADPAAKRRSTLERELDLLGVVPPKPE